MTPIVRLVAFAFALGLVFAASFAVGAAVGPDPEPPRPEHIEHPE